MKKLAAVLVILNLLAIGIAFHLGSIIDLKMNAPEIMELPKPETFVGDCQPPMNQEPEPAKKDQLEDRKIVMIQLDFEPKSGILVFYSLEFPEAPAQPVVLYGDQSFMLPVGKYRFFVAWSDPEVQPFFGEFIVAEDTERLSIKGEREVEPELGPQQGDQVTMR